MRSGLLALLAAVAFHPAAQTGVANPDSLREGSAITFLEGTSAKISMRSTDRLPEASGTVTVERRGGTTELDVELEAMKPAMLFGGDYNTYVLWVVPPRGAAANLGEVALDGTHATLHASTPATQFAILLSAEPHYLVSAPSPFVVLENKPYAVSGEVRYPVLEGIYNFERSTLDRVKTAKGKVYSELKQAFTALRLAQRADAPNLAPVEFAEAKRALDGTVKLWHQGIDRNQIAAQARKTVRLAVAAQHLAQDRAFKPARVEAEGSGGGKGTSGGRDLRGSRE